MQHHKTRFLAVGSYADSMGMGRVMRHLAAELEDRYEIHFLALGCPEKKVFDRNGIRYYPVAIPSIRCAHYASLMIRQLRPALTLLSIEPIWLPNYISTLSPLRRETRLLAYLPLEGRFQDPAIAPWIAGLDCAVVFTRYAEAEIRRIGRAYYGTEAPIRTAVVPHGVDRHVFFPLAGTVRENHTPEARKQAKQAAFPGRPELHEGFMALNPNLTYERKRLDLTLRGFARFARNKPADVRLCLHHSRYDADARRQLEQIIREENIADRVVFSPLDGPESGPLPIEQLNALYNACEVGINTAMGEGWGLTSFEHAAAGAAQIVPGHTTFLENWQHNAETIEVAETFRAVYPPFEMDVVSVESVADCLERLYVSEDYRLDMATRAHAHACASQFEWRAVADQWHTLFEQLLQPHSNIPKPSQQYEYA